VLLPGGALHIGKLQDKAEAYASVKELEARQRQQNAR